MQQNFHTSPSCHVASKGYQKVRMSSLFRYFLGDHCGFTILIDLLPISGFILVDRCMLVLKGGFLGNSREDSGRLVILYHARHSVVSGFKLVGCG